MDSFASLRAWIAGAGGVIGGYLGNIDSPLYALLAFMATDYVTGVLCGIAERSLSSSIGFRGICRKVYILALVGVANTLDIHVIGSGSVIRTTVIFFYISNEGISILENAERIGLPIPEKIRDVMKQLKNK